jgi:hypothetical protein
MDRAFLNKVVELPLLNVAPGRLQRQCGDCSVCCTFMEVPQSLGNVVVEFGFVGSHLAISRGGVPLKTRGSATTGFSSMIFTGTVNTNGTATIYARVTARSATLAVVAQGAGDLQPTPEEIDAWRAVLPAWKHRQNEANPGYWKGMSVPGRPRQRLPNVTPMPS